MPVRIHKFDAIKAVAMILVIVLHAYGMGRTTETLLKRLLIIDVLGVSMYLFSFISGWMMRPMRWNFKTIIGLCLVGAVMNSLIHFCRYSCGLIDAPNYLTAAYTLWYFWVMLVCKIVLPFFKYPVMALLISVAIYIFSPSYPSWMGVGLVGKFIGFFPFFAFGYFMANLDRLAIVRNYLCNDRHIVVWRCGLAGFAISAVVVSFSRYGSSVASLIANRHAAVGCSWVGLVARLGMALVITVWGLTWIKAMPSKELAISKLGTRTLAVYLLHTLPIFGCAAFARTIPYGQCAIMSIAVCICLLFFHRGFTDVFNRVVNLNWRTVRKSPK